MKPSIGPRVTIGFSDPHLEVILDGIAKRAPLTFVYKGDERIVDTYGMLAQRGFTAYPVPLGEFIKAGGAAKCLSLKLEQAGG